MPTKRMKAATANAEAQLRFSAVSHLISSAIAAFATRCITHPLDTVRARMQLETTLHSHRPSVRRTLVGIYRREGLRALYAGLSISLIFSVPGLGLYLSCYDGAKASLQQRWPRAQDSVWIHGAAAFAAEAASGIFWTPMEVIKNKQQSGDFNGSTWTLCKEIYKQEGMRGFLRGYLLTLGVFVPYTMVYFITYEKLKSQWANPEDIPFHGFMLSSALSGALAGAVSNVMDVVKTRMQVGSRYSHQMPTTELIRFMWRQEGGLRAFTRGMTARILWVIPSVTISMTVYESLKRHFASSN